MIFILKCRPPFGTHFLQLDFAKCHDLKEPRVHAWLAVGAPEWCFFLWPTRGRHVSKESAKSCRRLEERGGQLLGLFPGCWRFFSGREVWSCWRRKGSNQRDFRESPRDKVTSQKRRTWPEAFLLLFSSLV